MKKNSLEKISVLLIAFSAVLCLSLSSWKTDDDDKLSPSGSMLIGKWKLKEIKIDNLYVLLEPCASKGYIEFKADRSYHHFNVCDQSSLAPAKWVVKDDNLTILIDGDRLAKKQKIINLTKKKLILLEEFKGEVYKKTYKKIK